MKKVLLHGYTMDNLGDDLFFRVITNRYPEVQFVLPTLNINYKEKFEDISNLKVVDFCGIERLTSRKTYMLPKIYSMLHIKRFDAVVCIGGSLFIDRKNPTSKDRIEAENYSFIFDWEIARKAGVPYFILGANWGPCYNQYFFDYFSRAFNSMRDICFRDNYSYEQFKEKENVRKAGDILLDAAYVKKCISSKLKKKQILISVIDAARKQENQNLSALYEKRMAAIVDEFMAMGYRVVLSAFCEAEGDLEASKRIKTLTRKGSVEILAYRNNWKYVIQALADSELVLASRFHATVLGWTAGTAVFSIAYSDKTINLLQDFGVKDSFIPVQGIEGLDSARIMNFAGIPDNIDNLNAECSAFDILDEYLR